MSEQPKQEWENVGVAYLSNSKKALNLSLVGKVFVIPLGNLQKVIDGINSTVSISASK